MNWLKYNNKKFMLDGGIGPIYYVVNYCKKSQCKKSLNFSYSKTFNVRDYNRTETLNKTT